MKSINDLNVGDFVFTVGNEGKEYAEVECCEHDVKFYAWTGYDYFSSNAVEVSDFDQNSKYDLTCCDFEAIELDEIKKQSEQHVKEMMLKIENLASYENKYQEIAKRIVEKTKKY